ncbi:MFS transporter [Cryobacterium roopkundense]|uniref:MFS family permease n=1 Tax=Cryobacterium roopkundense TaxID=1001240 RepID=A0A7W9E5H0_9MICO|nr:MFS transporter [Cryobacterium roopkundense]MBB5643206.1 MFS family permease [Cryobacterium roopkundense]
MPRILRFGRRGTFWSAAAVLALCLWASGAPSVLYPVYAAEWNLSSVVTTSVFGAYPLALLVVLLVFGGLSDAIGRRRAMLVGVALITLSAAIFAVAPNVGFLFAGRVLQGVGTGFAIGAASAALVENNTSRNPRFASSMATVSTSTGLTLALFASGVLVQLAPLPLVLSFAVLFVLGLFVLGLVWCTPGDAPHTLVRVRPQAPRFPRGMMRVFMLSTVSVAVAYSIGAMFLSLGAQMARDLTGTSNVMVVGGLLAVSSLTIGVTALLLSRVHAHLSIMIGAVVSLAGLGLMAATTASGSVVLFLVWCVVGGIGYSFAFTGGLTLLNRTAPEHHRGGTLSLMYLFSYLMQAVTAIGAGALVTGLGLGVALGIAVPVLGVLCMVGLVLAAVDLVARRRIFLDAALGASPSEAA